MAGLRAETEIVIRRAALALLLIAGAARAGDEPPGAALFTARCAACHGTGEGMGPSLISDRFRTAWHGQSARQLYRRILSTMPANDPGSLSGDEALAVTLYLVDHNGVAHGAVAGVDGLDGLSL